ncbi:phosphoglucosamine mutase [Sporobacter termitidis DSM 10068]|uniref:Phosphoglucosamine mutase n=1 Tax=Sporobacter termitidis DSM 10068 TaxID=1123282 RepID=A0A1M5UGB3_9FIRM|nr:phosphoglucosamine mutase [Sporobacter termitidis]SHH62054.1 phosphoglucosamine mutase [Sporobacter termitidis DSM 10068]
MGKYFGTDGIRGVVNETLDAQLAYKVGCAAATVLLNGQEKRPLILIGKDTRISSDMLEAALIAGICSGGADVMPLGVLPTPAVAYLTVRLEAQMGIVISASHNPFEHNGIKIFNGQGYKLPDALEERIERMIDGAEPCLVKTHGGLGRVISDDGRGAEMYIDYLAGAVGGEIRGLRVAIDCANGAASETAGRLFSKFGIDFELLHDHPNGVNINDGCGSTHIDSLCRIVTAGGFDLGLAFDGDADRCLCVDEKGEVVDGDKMMAIMGLAMKERGALKNNAIVATVMSNIGFHEFAGKNGIELLCAAVGDRNVLELMLERGCNLGGEQSGHIIFLDDATTGDGQLAAVRFLSVVSASMKAVSALAGAVPQYPQVLQNAKITGGNAAKDAIMSSPRLKEAVAQEEKRLGGTGRILVRPSGTEALIRVMVEAKTEETASEAASKLINMIKSL